MTKEEICEIIADVMNDRNIDSIRDALITVKERVLKLPEASYPIKIPLHHPDPDIDDHVLLHCTAPFLEGDNYLYIDPFEKIDTGIYGAYWFGRE